MKSATKAINVLKCFSPAERHLTAAAIAERVGIHRVTAYSFLDALVESGLLQKDEGRSTYSVGLSLFRAGMLYLHGNPMLEEAKEVATLLNELTEEVVVICVLENGLSTNIMRLESKHLLKLDYRLGYSFPAYANATGKVLLSELSDSELDTLYPFEMLEPVTNDTVGTKSALRMELQQIRERGFAIVKGQASQNVSAVSSGIRDYTGKYVGAIAIALPMMRGDDSKLKLLSGLVMLAAAEIGSRLGHEELSIRSLGVAGIRSWWANEIARADTSKQPSQYAHRPTIGWTTGQSPNDAIEVGP